MIDVVFLVLVAIGIGVLLLILPIVSIVFSVKARRRVREMNGRLEQIEGLLEKGAGVRVKEAGFQYVRGETVVPGPGQLTDQALVPPVASEVPGSSRYAVEAGLAARFAVRAEPVESLYPAGAPAKTQPGPPPASASKRLGGIEERIGLTWFTRVGVLLIIIGLGFFFKYMVDNDWIGPWGRIAVGTLAGVFFLVTGEILFRRKNTHFIFVQGATGLGLSILLVTTYACFAFYHLVPVVPAFAVIAGLAVLGGALAVHQRAESILVLSLIAVFLNPVLLSTGVDRPLALFTYMLVMTSGVIVVAVRLGFQVAIWTAVTGIMLLFGGWYARFFDASPPPPAGTYDLPPGELSGAYYHLASRWIPLLFAVVYPLQWCLTGIAARLHGRRKLAVALYLAAAVGAHAAAAALLYDRPVGLGLAMCVLGVLFALLLSREDKTNWLGLPMAASFVVLASLTTGIEYQQLLPMMILTGGLAAIYFGVFFRKALRNNLLSSPVTLFLLGGAGLGLGIMGLLWMMPDHFSLLGLMFAVLSGIYLLVSLTVRSAWMIVSVFVLSLAGMGTAGIPAGSHGSEIQTAFIAVSALWAFVYIASVCVDMFVRGSTWDPARLFVLAGAGVGFTALFLAATPQEAGLPRALLSLATGVIYLLVGVRMTRPGSAGAERSLVPLGLALVLFTMSVAFLFTGVTVTVIWFVEALVLVYLASTARSRSWLIAAGLMFAVSVVRMLATDFLFIAGQQNLFRQTLGSEGFMVPTAFLHPRAIALAAAGIGMLLSASLVRRHRQLTLFRPLGVVFAVCGHLAVLALLITEFRILFTDLSLLPPAGLPREEFFVVLFDFNDSLYAQSHRLDMVATVVMGLYAAFLLSAGFIFRSKPQRLMGMLLFASTLGKLVFWDVWELERVYQIVVLVSVGLLLLAGGFLYARFGKRLKTLLVEGGRASLPVALLLLFWPANAAALETGRYEQVRIVEGIDKPGDYRLLIDPDLYSASYTVPELRDIRIFGPDGNEVPYIIRPVQIRPQDETREARVVDPVLLPDGASRATLDLGPAPTRHHRVVLTIDGYDYMRPTLVESSSDGKTFGILSEGAFLFDISTGGPRAKRNWITYPVSMSRFLRVTLKAGNDSKRLEIKNARVYTGEDRGPEYLEGSIDLDFEPGKKSEEGVSRYLLEAIPRGVPVSKLDLQVATLSFVRRIKAEASTRKHAWFAAGGGLVYRVEHQGRKAEQLSSFPVQPAGRPYLRLLCFDGDNPPLEIEGIRAKYPVEEILLRTSNAGTHTLYIGRKDDGGPEYDLGSILARQGAVDAASATMGPLHANPAKTEPLSDETGQAWTERHATVIQIVLLFVVIILAVWTVLLIRKNRAGR